MEFLWGSVRLDLDFLCRHGQVSAARDGEQASSRLDRNQGRRLLPGGQFTRRTHRKERPMLDFILLAVGLAFFALSIAYAFGCDRL
jgi:hypothetical protein